MAFEMEQEGGRKKDSLIWKSLQGRRKSQSEQFCKNAKGFSSCSAAERTFVTAWAPAQCQSSMAGKGTTLQHKDLRSQIQFFCENKL